MKKPDPLTEEEIHFLAHLMVREQMTAEQRGRAAYLWMVATFKADPDLGLSKWHEIVESAKIEEKPPPKLILVKGGKKEQ